MSKSSYIIEGGKSGSDRLLVMANATWETTQAFLRNAGLKPGMHVLDLGCGNGDIARRYAVSIMDMQGQIVGIDRDDTAIDVAEKSFQAIDMKTVFRKADLETDSLSDLGKFDFIYTRFILSHLKEPAEFLRKVSGLLGEKGVLAVEDVDFDGHVSYPQNDSFDRYVELYKKAALKHGGDPLIGRKLPSLFEKAEFAVSDISCVCPPYTSGDGKLMAQVTFDLISGGLVEDGLITEDERQKTMAGLVEFTHAKGSMMTLPRIFQVVATHEAEVNG